MASSVVINDSSSPSSSLRHQCEDSEYLEFITKISDLNQQCQGLGHEVSRLVLENVENDERLGLSKRRIEDFNRSESRLSCEIEQLERKILKLMIEKRLKDAKLEQYGLDEESEDMKYNRLEKMSSNLVPEIEVRNDLNDFHWSDDDDVQNEINLVNVRDDGEEEEECELCKQIELLEVMLERGSSNLFDVKMMMQEVEALNGPEEMTNEMDGKMRELESGLWQLKSAVEELKGKKSMELMGLVTEDVEEEFEHDGIEEVNARKMNWGSVLASIGAVVGAVAAAMVLMGRTRVKVAADGRNKQKTG